MPLRDHFRPPVDNKHSWDALHGGWPMVIVQHLFGKLPPGYFAAPTIHLGNVFEVDVATYEQDEAPPPAAGGGSIPAAWAAPTPTLTLEADLSEPDEYEVRVYDANRGRQLVAAIELVSPSNKDRADRRRAFVAKTAALIRQDVCVSVVDVVTVRHANLYRELLDELGLTDPSLGAEPPAVYAATVRARKRHRRRPVVDTWYHPLAVGQPLPSLPLWLDADLGVTLDLEASYEDTCRVLHIS